MFTEMERISLSSNDIVGTLVECIDASGSIYLKLWKTYKVLWVNGSWNYKIFNWLKTHFKPERFRIIRQIETTNNNTNQTETMSKYNEMITDSFLSENKDKIKDTIDKVEALTSALNDVNKEVSKKAMKLDFLQSQLRRAVDSLDVKEIEKIINSIASVDEFITSFLKTKLKDLVKEAGDNTIDVEKFFE